MALCKQPYSVTPRALVVFHGRRMLGARGYSFGTAEERLSQPHRQVKGLIDQPADRPAL